MNKLKFNDDTILYRKGDRLKYFYIIRKGSAKITINNHSIVVSKGTIGEWAIVDVPAYETVEVYKNSEIVSVLPEELIKWVSTGEIFFMIIMSLSIRLNLADKEISETPDPDIAIKNFKKHHHYYSIIESNFIDNYKLMKYYFRNNEFQKAYNILLRIDNSKIDSDAKDEVELWKLILKYFMNPYNYSEVAYSIGRKEIRKHLSFKVLENIVDNKNDKFVELYAKYGLYLPKKSMLILEGQKSKDEGYLLVNGSMKVSRFTDENEKLLWIMVNGEFFGEAALFESEIRKASVYCDVNSEIIIFSPEILKKSIITSKDLSLKLIENQIQRILFTNKIKTILKYDSQFKRVDLMLDNFYERFKKSKLSITEVANMCNAEVSEVLNVLNSRKIKIDVNGYLK